MDRRCGGGDWGGGTRGLVMLNSSFDLYGMIEELTYLTLLWDCSSVSTRISSEIRFRLWLALCVICIINFEFCDKCPKTVGPIWVTYIGLFSGDIMEQMLLSAYSVKLLHDKGSPCIKEILHTIALGI